MELEEILDGEEQTQTVEAAETPAVETEKPELETKGETETETPAVEEVPTVETPATEDDKEASAFKTMALDERSKRQELERQLEALQRPQEQPKAPDVLDDQEGFVGYIKTEVQTAVSNATANLSEQLARRDHPDLDEKFEAYKELVKANPELHSQVQQSLSPWHEMVSIVDKSERLKAMENVDDWEAKERARIREELEAEIKGEIKAVQDKTADISPSLATAPAAGKVGNETWSGPTPMDHILN